MAIKKQNGRKDKLKGANILVGKSPLGDKAVLAFIVEEGIPIELIQNL